MVSVIAHQHPDEILDYFRAMHWHRSEPAGG
jgi:hypothetical protein